jgi:hypothetical protein
MPAEFDEARPRTDAVDGDDRRRFLTTLALSAGTLALGIGGATFGLASDAAAASPLASTHAAPDPKNWLVGLKGKHRQLVDAFSPNEGFPLAFAHTFLLPQTAAEPGGAVVVLRHFAMPIALSSDMWAKYKLGENLKVMDPVTKKPATRNPFYKAPAGSLLADDMAVDKLLGRGVIFGACNVALNVMSATFAPSAGVTKEVAAKEWMAAIIPGITVIPSGTWGVNRAQEAGCTYCSGGG